MAWVSITLKSGRGHQIVTNFDFHGQGIAMAEKSIPPLPADRTGTMIWVISNNSFTKNYLTSLTPSLFNTLSAMWVIRNGTEMRSKYAYWVKLHQLNAGLFQIFQWIGSLKYFVNIWYLLLLKSSDVRAILWPQKEVRWVVGISPAMWIFNTMQDLDGNFWCLILPQNTV